MSDGRRLADVLLKFQEAREELLREMGVGQPLNSADSGRQLARLRELHEVVQITKAAVAEADEVYKGRQAREQRKAAELAERRNVLKDAAAVKAWPGDR